MKKRIISLILVMICLVSLFPSIRAEERADKPKTIEEQIQSFADSIDQTGAESSAAMALAMHGITGGGKKLILNESSALTALLFNSSQFQYWLIEGCTNAIASMQGLDMDVMPNMRGWCDWDSAQIKTGLVFHQKPDYGSTDWKLIWTPYSGQWNDYDRSLEWMTGISAEDMQITRTKVLEDRAVYRVDLTIFDSFDFHTANSTGFKDLISGIGMLMFQEFEWESRVSFTLEVPYTCHHSSGAYHWTYDAEKNEMISDSGNGYTENTTERRHSINDRDYFALEETVRLLHDRPWVMEYDAKNQKDIPMFPVESGYYFSRLMFRHSSGNYIMLRDKRWVPAEDHSEDDYTYIYGTIMQYLSSLISGNRKRLLTYRLENQVYPDGSNMIFLSILDPQTGTVLVDKRPMDDYSETYQGVEDSTLISKESDWLSGKDLYINYIGNRSVGFKADYFDLRIWENGVGGEPESYYKTIDPVPATCTEDGYTAQVCTACGHTIKEITEPARGHRYTVTVTEPGCTSGGFTRYICDCGDTYVSDQIDALGHNWTDWAAEGEWDCTEGGTQERHCLRCGQSETKEVASTAHLYEARIVEPTCVDLGYTIYTCAVCGYSYKTNFTNTGDHSFGPWSTLREATEQQEGLLERSCTVCGVTEQKRIPKLQNPFSDVGAADYFYAPVLWAVSRGITTGTSATTFEPDSSCLRAQVVTFLWRAAGEPEPSSHTNPFVDVKKSDYYYKAVLWAVENGITNGIDGTHFGPETACSRSQVVTFLYRAFGKPTVENTDNPFADVPGSEWYTAPVLWAVEKGITNGLSADSFGPDNECSRSQIVTFLYRSYN